MANIDFIIKAIEDSLDMKSFDTKYLIMAIDEYCKSYSHKPHLAELPHDLNTNNPDELKERLDACKEGLKEAKKDLKDKEKESGALDSQIKENEQSINDLKKENEELQNNVDHINSTMSQVYEHFDKVSEDAKKDAEDLKEWEYLLDSEYLAYGGDTDEVSSDLKHFYEDIVPKGYLGPEDVKFVNELADKIDELPIYDDGYSEGHDRFMGDVTGWSDDMKHYAEKYDINGDNENTRELNRREEGMSDKWYEITARDEKKIESNNVKIDGLEKDNEKLHSQKVGVDKDVRKLNTKVKDYSEHQVAIEEKIESVKD